MAEFEVNGVTLTVPDDFLTRRISEKLGSGGYEGQEADAVRRRLRPGWRVLELGSGIGYVASVCAGITGAENVVTVEANPDMLPVVRDNLDRNGFKGTHVIHGAVGGRAEPGETVEFENAKAFWGAHIATEDSAGGSFVSVPLLGIADLLKAHRPHMVIMDIEGAEAHLFDAPWPEHVRSVVMELHPGRYPDTVIKAIVDCLSASGLTYDPWPSCGRILGFRRLRHA
ncbi:FkbM family methyltransferase [Roseovarius sp. TE539]|uniref:FkbM family methyltransferase n=1 Tax=Roseovarius sp. TE539 TaxID=2249812 RepID=UPI000DDC5B35|nr:FkbM family methyltransferase [Roseovarius sp. TE539]RBI74127.1 FkbM family methyltransferase [Roseovarius sp. TE539]